MCGAMISFRGAQSARHVEEEGILLVAPIQGRDGIVADVDVS